MSVLNQMLKDLDKRGAVPLEAGEAPLALPQGRNWGWQRILLLALLLCLLLALAWWLGRQQAEARPAAKVPTAAGRLAQAQGAATQSTPAKAIPPPPPALPKVQERRLTPMISADKPGTLPAAKANKPAELMPVKVRTEAALPPPIKAQELKPLAEKKPAKIPVTKTHSQGETKGEPKVQRELLTPAQQAEQSYQAGLLAWQDGDWAEAEHRWRQALAAEASHQEATLALAGLYQQQGRLDEAAAVLLPMSASSPAVNLALARVLVQKRDLAAAYRQLNLLPPTSREGQQLRAELARLTGHGQAAVQLYRALVEHYPADGRLWLALGLSLEGQGDKSGAAQAFGKAAASAQLSQEARRYALARQQALGGAR
ncbi:tetratricopeptide repeat protein [Gallaecimonas kandeliae]|uniref:tetratricopeptide repeat protein n=1 Tax=Gallaecimonas kandeliae TaxID=3029055 RepID=UPI002647B30C|nr:tetratricopeptide repeat protein [Gallaecimonas kandeliae]WKE66017.1 tetratricopeptide repeat protein [Gallaecimonas kandeliae]